MEKWKIKIFFVACVCSLIAHNANASTSLEIDPAISNQTISAPKKGIITFAEIEALLNSDSISREQANGIYSSIRSDGGTFLGKDVFAFGKSNTEAIVDFFPIFRFIKEKTHAKKLHRVCELLSVIKGIGGRFSCVGRVFSPSNNDASGNFKAIASVLMTGQDIYNIKSGFAEYCNLAKNADGALKNLNGYVSDMKRVKPVLETSQALWVYKFHDSRYSENERKPVPPALRQNWFLRTFTEQITQEPVYGARMLMAGVSVYREELPLDDEFEKFIIDLPETLEEFLGEEPAAHACSSSSGTGSSSGAGSSGGGAGSSGSGAGSSGGSAGSSGGGAGSSSGGAGSSSGGAGSSGGGAGSSSGGAGSSGGGAGSSGSARSGRGSKK